MERLITLTSALLWLGPHNWAKKPEPPAISTRYGRICLTELRWRRPGVFDDQPYASIEGILVNGSDWALSTVHLAFTLYSGSNTRDTAHAFFGYQIPPGGRRWFAAQVIAADRSIFTRSDTVELSYSQCARDGSQSHHVTLHFDPLFNPFDRADQKMWESIHGKRKR